MKIIRRKTVISLFILAFVVSIFGLARFPDGISYMKGPSLATGALFGVFKVVQRLVSSVKADNHLGEGGNHLDQDRPPSEDWRNQNPEYNDPGAGRYAPDDGDFRDKGGEFSGDSSRDKAKFMACGGQERMGSKEAQFMSFFYHPGVQLYMDCTRTLIYMMPEMVKMTACMARMLSDGSRGTFTHQLTVPMPPSFKQSGPPDPNNPASFEQWNPRNWEQMTMTMKVVVEDNVDTLVYGLATHTKVSFYVGATSDPDSLTAPQVVWTYGSRGDVNFGLFIKSGRDPMSPVAESIVYKYLGGGAGGYIEADAGVQETYGISGFIQRANVLFTIQTGSQAFGQQAGAQRDGTFAHLRDMTWDIDAVLGEKQADGSALTHVTCSLKDPGGIKQVAGIGDRNGEMTLAFSESYLGSGYGQARGFEGKKIMKVDWGDSGVRADTGQFDRGEHFSRPNFQIRDAEMSEGEVPPEHRNFQFRPPEDIDRTGNRVFNDSGGFSAIPPEKMNEMLGDDDFFKHDKGFGGAY